MRLTLLLTTSFLSVSVGLVSPLAAAQSWSDDYPPPAHSHGEEPYSPVLDWLKPFAEEGYVWGSHPGIFIESPERIFIIQRGELHVPAPRPPEFGNFYGSVEGWSALRPKGERVMRNVIFVVNSEGELQESWTQWDHLFEGTMGPHKVAISPYDPERRVWVVNDARHQIHAFSNDGKELLMSLGTWGEGGEGPNQLGRPQDIAFQTDGSILVADGLDNSRVVKYDAKGNFIKAWGTKGSADGQFDAVHGIATDKDDRIYVADRNNDRIQVFDRDGKHLASWNGLNFPNHIVITANQDVWVSDNQPVRLIKFNRDGQRLYSWDAHGRGPGQFEELHEFGVDAIGNWYGADNILGRSLKFVPKANADPAKLMQKPLDLAQPKR